jgi:signal transduction histidine kinase
MARRTLDSSALARLLVATMVGVVTSFLLVSVVARVRARGIEGDVEGIIANAMPSVRDLSSARGAVHHMDAYADLFYESTERGADLPTAPLDAELTALQKTLDAYAMLTAFADERAPQRDLTDGVRELASAVPSLTAATAAATARGGRQAAEASLARFHSDAERVDTILERLVEINTSHGIGLGLHLRALRTKTQHTVLFLDTVVVLLTLAATALALLTLRRSVGSLEAANRHANERVTHLEQRSSELDRFAGRVAHDVLSPLSSATLALGMVRRRFEGDAATQSIVSLVDGLLEFARAGARPESGARADIGDVIDGIVSVARADAAAQGTDVRVDPFAPCAVACSGAVLASISGNLIRNALKHMGDATERVVRVGVSRREDQCRVEVEDTGPGVPAALEQTIFEPFVRARTDTPGVGLGLATVKQLVSAHGGRLGYARGSHGGSLFWFELPLARARTRDDETNRAAEIAQAPPS